MTSEQLVDELQKAKILTEELASKLKKESALSGRSAEELIYAGKLIDDRRLAEVKSAILKVPYKKLDFSSYDNQLLEIIPEETARTYAVVPIEKKGNILVVGMLHPDDLKATEALKFIARRYQLNLGVYLISWSDWQEVLRRYSPYKTEIAKAVQAVAVKSSPATSRAISLEAVAATSGEEAPIIKIVASTLQEAVRLRASDIHFEPQENYLRVRFRIDGELKEEAALPLELSRAVISRIKVMSNLKIDETRIPQDGRFRVKMIERDIDFRVSTFPTPLGEKVAIRVLDPTVGLKSFENLGLSGKNLEIIEDGLEKPFGMILVTGPTGSGKTTTLYALLQRLNKENVNIVSLEDPVEYLISGINQSQVHPEIGYDFASGLRQILRQDPDVIMVGEIRDSETATLAVQAALTGHIVLSTLHTNNAFGVIPRLIDMKVEPFLLPVSLNLMIAQRLVGRLCPDCQLPTEAPPALARVIENTLKVMPEEIAKKYSKPYRIFRASGCAKCRGRGVVGRIALFEVFKMTPALEEIISSGPTVQKILKEARNQGIFTLREDGVIKALEGVVSLEEVIRETEEV